MDDRRQFEAFLATGYAFTKLLHGLFSVVWINAVEAKEPIRVLRDELINHFVRYRVTLWLLSLQEIAGRFSSIHHSPGDEDRLVNAGFPHLRQKDFFVTVVFTRNVRMGVDDHL